MEKMRKTLYRLLTAVLSTGLLSGLPFSIGAADHISDTLEAFYALQDSGDATDRQEELTEKTTLLEAVMSEKYAQVPEKKEDAAHMAEDLQPLCGIMNADLAAYASSRNLKMAQVRNAYYKALANVLRAEITVNPRSEEKYRTIQTILMLFLASEDSPGSAEEKAAVREKMSPSEGRDIAGEYGLPEAFVDFIIMDADWQDADWNNDTLWRAAWGWDTGKDGLRETLYIGSRDAAGEDTIFQMQQKLADLGYLHSTPDGVFGPLTQTALLEFQLANGLKATGIYTDEEKNLLFGGIAVARQNYGDDFWDPDDADDFYDDDRYDDDGDDDDFYDDRYDDDGNDDDFYDDRYDDDGNDDDFYDDRYDDDADDDDADDDDADDSDD